MAQSAGNVQSETLLVAWAVDSLHAMQTDPATVAHPESDILCSRHDSPMTLNMQAASMQSELPNKR
jgi:hypothetical protein